MKVKIEAKTLLPAILHFSSVYLTPDDHKILEKCLRSSELATDIDKDPIVKAGGLPKLLQNYMKENKNLAKALQGKKRKNSEVSKADDESEEEEENKNGKAKKR